jgi:hypothetical protein
MPSPFERKPLHASDGKVHVGTALILACLAIAVSSLLVLGASAQTTRPAREPGHTAIMNELRQLNRRLEKVENILERVSGQCLVEARQCEEPVEEQPLSCEDRCREQAASTVTRAFDLNACLRECTPAPADTLCFERCTESFAACKKNAGQDEVVLRGCNTKYESCGKECMK